MENNEKDIITSDDTTLASLAHISAFSGVLIPFGNIIAPFIFYAMKRNESKFIAEHALEAVNFQITLSLGLIICSLLFFTIVGIPLAFIGWGVLSITGLVLTIVAAIKASDGKRYDYPFSFRIVS